MNSENNNGDHCNFERGSERNFTIGQSPQIWVNFLKISMNINKHLNIIEKIREKCKFFRKCFNFRAGIGKKEDK